VLHLLSIAPVARSPAAPCPTLQSAVRTRACVQRVLRTPWTVVPTKEHGNAPLRIHRLAERGEFPLGVVSGGMSAHERGVPGCSLKFGAVPFAAI